MRRGYSGRGGLDANEAELKKTDGVGGAGHGWGGLSGSSGAASPGVTEGRVASLPPGPLVVSPRGRPEAIPGAMAARGSRPAVLRLLLLVPLVAGRRGPSGAGGGAPGGEPVVRLGAGWGTRARLVRDAGSRGRWAPWRWGARPGAPRECGPRGVR